MKNVAEPRSAHLNISSIRNTLNVSALHFCDVFSDLMLIFLNVIFTPSKEKKTIINKGATILFSFRGMSGFMFKGHVRGACLRACSWACSGGMFEGMFRGMFGSMFGGMFEGMFGDMFEGMFGSMFGGMLGAFSGACSGCMFGGMFRSM